jgi:hypothetical protein
MICNIIRSFNLSDKKCNLDEINTLNKVIKVKDDSIENLTKNNNSLQEKLNNCLSSDDLIRKELDSCSSERESIKKELDGLKESIKPDPLEKELNEKYPAAYVLYTGRKLVNRLDYLKCDVRQFITPNDYYVQKIVEENKWREIPNYEDRIVAVYKWYKLNLYSYEYDDRLYGGNYPEMWALPFETLGWREHEGKAVGDCEDAAFVQQSLYLAAGVPYYLVRSSCGTVPNGEGHCTNYIYSKTSGKWHHCNSTFGQSKIPDKLIDFPTTEDAYSKKDAMGIYKPWFSMNLKFAFSGGITGASKKEFNKNFIFV